MVNSSRESAAKQGSMDSRKYPSCFRTIPGMNVSKVRSIHLANNGDFVYFDAASVLKAKLLEPACVGSIWSCHLSDTGRYLWWYQGVGRLSPGPRYAPPGDPLVYYPLRPHCRKHPYSQIFPRFVCSKFPSVFLQTALPAVWLWMYDSCAASPSSCSRGKAFSGAMQIRNTTPSLWLLRPGEPAGRLYRIRNWRREC
jgi:hypothetical protein